MGWGRMMLLGNVGQQLDIQDLENAIGQMQADAARTQNLDQTQEESIDELRRETHELKLYLATIEIAGRQGRDPAGGSGRRGSGH